MALSYSLLLIQGTQELLEISQSLKLRGPSLPRVRRLKYLAGFLGIQKLSDLGFWLEDWLESGEIGSRLWTMKPGIYSVTS